MSVDMSLGVSVRRLRQRVRVLLVERWSLYGAAVGCAVASVIVALSYKYDDLIDYRLWGGVVLLFALAGAAWALARRLEDLSVAIAADRRTGLKERLSTALALGDSGDAPEMVQALISDAGTRVSAMRPKEVFRHRFGWPHWSSGTAMAVLVAVIFVPQLPGMQPESRRREVAVLREQGAKVAKLADELKKKSAPNYHDMRGLSDRLKKLGWKMQTGRMQKKQAMLQLQKLTKTIQQEQDRMARENSSEKSMEQARAEMQKASAELEKKMADKMAEKENIPPEEALKKLPSDKRLAELARKEEALTQAEKQELEQAVERYANPSNNSPIPSELGEAMAKLAANGDYQKAAELMQKLSQKLNAGNMKPADAESLKKQMDALAKALKNTDLDKLAKQMLENAEKLSKMSPEELKKMVDQMQKMQQMAKALQKAGGG